VTEAQLQDAVIACARYLGWKVAHFRTAQTGRGWRTAVAGDGKGYPDLTLAHRDHGLLFVELKAERGVMSPEQDEWLEVLRAAGAAVAVFKPRDWLSGTVEAVLRGC
jgi:hypothetical protein